MEKEKYKQIEIVQITSVADGGEGVLWGVSNNGNVYEYHFQKKEWQPLSMLTPTT